MHLSGRGAGDDVSPRTIALDGHGEGEERQPDDEGEAAEREALAGDGQADSGDRCMSSR